MTVAGGNHPTGEHTDEPGTGPQSPSGVSPRPTNDTLVPVLQQEVARLREENSALRDQSIHYIALFNDAVAEINRIAGELSVLRMNSEPSQE